MNRDLNQVLESLIPEFVSLKDLKKTHYFENQENKEAFDKLQNELDDGKKNNIKSNNKKNGKRAQ